MVSVEMSVREMIQVANEVQHTNPGLYERIVTALTHAVSAATVAAKSRITVISLSEDKFIACIKAFRLVTGFGLKEAKDFFDVVRGPWLGYNANCDNHYGNGQPNSIVLEADKARKLFDELSKLDCVVTMTDNHR